MLQAPAICGLLLKLHLKRNTACSIVFGPENLRGLALPHLYTEQGIKKLQLFFGPLCLQDKTGKLITIDMTYIQLLTSITTLLLNETYT